MEYRDRAVEALHAAENRLRAELRTIIMEAVAAEAYTDVAAIARLAEGLSHIMPPTDGEANGGDEQQAPPTVKLFGADWPDSVRATAAEQIATMQTLHPRGSSRRDQYPRFLRDGNRLVKLAWSKKERAPYEHRAPREVVQALVDAVQRRKGENKLFQASDVMPLKNSMRDEYPSYQSYLALNWLRDAGVISKRGREGYVLRPNAATAEKLDALWTALPAAEVNE
jgi:hypothetical protein